jgi:hypothetical protein
LALGLMLIGGCAGFAAAPDNSDGATRLAHSFRHGIGPGDRAAGGGAPWPDRLPPRVDGVEAFALRGLSARKAGRSLMCKYYIWHDDLTGRLLARELLLAADRAFASASCSTTWMPPEQTSPWRARRAPDDRRAPVQSFASRNGGR